LEKQLKVNVERGWLGMFVSLDCMHYCLEKLSNCSIRFIHKQRWEQINHLRGHSQLEVVDLVYFGLVRSNNDLNVLDKSREFLGGAGVDLNFEMNGNIHFHHYLLTNGIYP
jgi:hypothetical protein